MLSVKDKISLSNPDLIVVGAGLAGSECAWQAAQKGLSVLLIEQRPEKKSSAHQTAHFAELVCSNSFKSLDPLSAPGLLKKELHSLGSLIISEAHRHQVAAGQALAVNRHSFSAGVTEKIEQHPLIEIHHSTINHFEELIHTQNSGEKTPVVWATGPLTGELLAESFEKLLGLNRLYFYDAIAPIVDGESIDRNIAFLQNRRFKGSDISAPEGDYLNCPLDENEYLQFIAALKKAEIVPTKDFEKTRYFQGCQPIEALLEKGDQSLRFGPMKAIGLKDPRIDQRPYAVVQLRKEDSEGRAWNMVGFQTKLKYPEQKKIFKLIPGLEKAEFFRLGSLHRNTYIQSPLLLAENFSLKHAPHFYFAGQITGVEGYLESTAIGALVALNISFQKQRKGAHLPLPPQNTALGALAHAVLHGRIKNFQPMNINWGLIPYGDISPRDPEKKTKLCSRAERNFKNWRSLTF